MHPVGDTDDARANADIDRAGRYLEQGKLDVAAELLDDVEKEFGSRLSQRARFRVGANRGHVLRLRGDAKGAAKLYLEAKQHQPDDRDARFLVALAHHLLREDETARRLACDLRRDFPDFARASLIEIVAAPHGTSYADLDTSVPAAHRDNAEVLAAMARKAVAEGDFATAEQQARRAHELEPNWVEPALVLADAIVESEFGEGGWVEPAAAEARVVARLQEAGRLLDEALEKGGLVPADVRVNVRLDRAAVYEAVGQHDQARAEFLAIYRQMPDHPDAVLRYAATLAGEGRTDDAIAVLHPVVSRPDCPPQVLLLYAQLVAERNREKDRVTALDMLRGHEGQWPAAPMPFRIAWVQTFAHLLLDAEGADAARTFLNTLPTDAVPLAIHLALRARTEQTAGDDAKAAAMADEAARAVTDESRPDDVRRLAIMLQNMGKPEKAFPLWRRVVPPGRLTADTRHLLRCADRCGEEDVIIDVCADLRRSGHVDRECLDLEIAALSRRSPQSAAALIRELLGGSADESIKRFLRLRLSHIGLYAKQPVLVESDPSLLPTVEEVNAKTGRAVVGVLVHSGSARAAVAYAYELYRRFPDDFDAHMAVVESFGLIGGGREPEITNPNIVRPGCAVCIQPSGTRKREWWIIEDGPNPSLARGERPVDDVVVQRMLGKAKGESFVFRAEPLPVEARVIKIEDKYLFRWRDCMSGMETRFSQKTPIWTINVRRGRGKYDFTEFLRQLDRHAQKAKERDEWYRDHPVPLAMFAEASGKSVLEAAMYVAGKSDLPFRCCTGSLAEIENSTAALKNCNRLVIDASALSVLFLTGTSGWLEKVPAECVVTEHTLYGFRRMNFINRPADEELVRAGKAGDQYVHEVWKPEHLRPLRERIEGLIRDIERHCTVVPGVSLSPLLPEHRKVLEEACGRDVAESIVTAADPMTVLWTDDRAVSDLAGFSLKVRRTWTQAVFEWLWSDGIAGEEVRDRLAVDLTAAGYYWTRLTPGAVLLAGAEAGWDVESPRFGATLLRFSSPDAEPRGLLLLAAGVLKGVWQCGLLAHQVDAVTFRILKLLDSRTNGRRLIEALVRLRYKLFGGDILNADRMAACAATWMEVNRKDAIIIPGPLQ